MLKRTWSHLGLSSSSSSRSIKWIKIEYPASAFSGGRTPKPKRTSMSETITQDFCLVEKILDKRIDADTGTTEYLIKWQGTDAEGKELDNSWEPEHNILGEDLLAEFEREQQAAKGNRSYGSAQAASPVAIGSERRRPRSRYASGSSPHPLTTHHDLSIAQPIMAGLPPSLYPPHPDMRLGPSHAYSLPYRYTPGHPSRQQHPSMPQYSVHPSYDRVLVLNEPKPNHGKPCPDDLPSPSGGAQSTTTAAHSEADKNSEATTLGSSSEPASKRYKADPILRSQQQLEVYLSRRRADATTGEKPTTVRPLLLKTRRERADFKAVIHRSTLLKDTELRNEMEQFVLNPENHGLTSGAALLESELWLVEIKAHEGKSLFLALDVTNGKAMALHIPEWMLEGQRGAKSEEGIRMTDRAIVSAIMAGNIEDSGLYPSSSSSAGSVSQPPVDHPAPELSPKTSQEASTTVSSTQEENQRTNGPLADHHSKDTLSTKMASCEWRGCTQTLLTMDELVQHVQKEHLRANAAFAQEFQSNGTHDPEGFSPSRDMDIDGPNAGSSWATRYGVLQEDYRSLNSDITAMRERLKKMNDQIRDSNTHYTSAITATRQNIKRLEAVLEWEQKKWEKYQVEKRRMMARDGEQLIKAGGPESETAIQNGEAQTSVDNQMETNTNGRASDRGDYGQLDTVIEAQARNSIREIQKSLVAAKDNEAQLKTDREQLMEKKRAMEAEYQKIDQLYQTTITRLSQTESQLHKTREEVKTRTLGVEECKESMEQEQQQHQTYAEQLRSKIETLHQSMPSTTQQPSQPQPPAPSALSAALVQTQPNGQLSQSSPMLAQDKTPTSTAAVVGPGETVVPIIADQTNFIDLLTRNTEEPRS
ncbi:hypothetical protein KVV02_004562 [Mortierella alpina]|uniref:Chromo domain-containing protein n=1 Tax=Mortierella alpina TaxID=64518 RepID=A0A9P8A170_MORAP|nr:hypothetical protein KVV02_004562 [Mortierella alpina]